MSQDPLTRYLTSLPNFVSYFSCLGTTKSLLKSRPWRSQWHHCLEEVFLYNSLHNTNESTKVEEGGGVVVETILIKSLKQQDKTTMR